MIVHAAGESAVLLRPSSSEKERPVFNRKVGGLSLSSGSIYGSGVAESVSSEGEIPSSRAILPDNTIAVVLSVKNEARLVYTAAKLKKAGVPYVLVREIDLDDQATAIGIMPCRRERVGRALKDCIVFLRDEVARV